MYAFAKTEAGRSFREAQRRDPNCAICYWGEAWAWGPYVNGRMTRTSTPAARMRPFRRRSRSRMRTRTRRSRRSSAPWAPAVCRALRPVHTPRRRTARMPRPWLAWPASYPDDLDVATLYAEALFLLLPRPAAFAVNEPTVGAHAGGARGGAEARYPSPGRVPSLHPHDRADGRTQTGSTRAPSISAMPFLARATSTTCPRTSGPGSGDGATRCGPACTRGNPIRTRPGARGS